MSNNQILKLSAVIALTAILLTFAAVASSSLIVDAKKPTEVKVKPKPVQNVKITANIDTSGLTNLTQAAAAYNFILTSGTYTSQAKLIENITSGDIQVVFAGKLPVSPNDGVTITAVSNSDNYNTVAASGTLTEKSLGKSGKTSLESTVDIELTENSNIGVS
jgi:hypothetical protein